MTYRIYRTDRYGNDTSAAKDFPSSIIADCTQDQAEYLANTLSTYSDAGCDDQFLVECPECGHRDVTDCSYEHVLPKRAVPPETKPVFTEEGITLYGKLFHLKDKSQETQEDRAEFWGELRLDNGNRWRIQFARALESETSPLFTRQVCLTGTAHYFEKRSPKLVVRKITEDLPRDYEAAFDEMVGTEPDLFAEKTLQEILAE